MTPAPNGSVSVSSQLTAPMASASLAPCASSSSTFSRSAFVLKPAPLADRPRQRHDPHRPFVDSQRGRVRVHPRERRAIAQKLGPMLAGVCTLLARRLVVNQGQSASHINPNRTTPPSNAPPSPAPMSQASRKSASSITAQSREAETCRTTAARHHGHSRSCRWQGRDTLPPPCALQAGC